MPGRRCQVGHVDLPRLSISLRLRPKPAIEQTMCRHILVADLTDMCRGVQAENMPKAGERSGPPGSSMILPHIGLGCTLFTVGCCCPTPSCAKGIAVAINPIGGVDDMIMFLGPNLIPKSCNARSCCPISACPRSKPKAALNRKTLGLSPQKCGKTLRS